MKFNHNKMKKYKPLWLYLSDYFFGNLLLIPLHFFHSPILKEHLFLNLIGILLASFFKIYKHYHNTIDINIFKKIIFIFIPINSLLLFSVYGELILSLFYSYIFWISVLLIRTLIIKAKLVFINLGNKNCMILGCGMASRHVGRVLSDSNSVNFLGYIKVNSDYKLEQIDSFKVYDFQSIHKYIKLKNIKLLYLPNDLILDLDEKKYLDKLNKEKIIIKNTKNIAQLIEEPDDELKIIDSLISRSDYKVKKSELQHLENKNILVTGGGGSIGSQIVNVLLENTTSRVFVIDNSEKSLFELKQYLGKNSSRVEFFLGDIRFIHDIDFKINPSEFNYIINAAAYKHVLFVQDNFWQGINVNYLGTKSLLKFRKKHNIDSFVQISTDKAVNPTTFMGFSKRLAELEVLSDQYSKSKKNKNVNTIVRFGNVIGSSGSVIPIFQDLIKNNKPITIFDKKLTRYMMTINEAVSLVLIAANFKFTKSIFVLDMGKEISILELAKKMVVANGKTYTYEHPKFNEIQIKFGKLPEYEKLSEVLYINEIPKKTDNNKILYVKDLEINKHRILLRSISKYIDSRDKCNLLSICRKEEIFFN